MRISESNCCYRRTCDKRSKFIHELIIFPIIILNRPTTRPSLQSGTPPSTMTSRFAALCSDSDSDDDSHASPNIKPSVVPVAPPPIQRSYVQPEQHYQQQSSYQDHYQQQSSYQQFNAPQPVVEDAGFKAVPKKKSMKAQKITDLPEKMGANALLAEEIRNDARAAEKSAGYGGNAGHTVSGGGHYGAGGGHGEYVGNGGQMAGGANVYSQFSGGVPAGNGHMGTSPVKGGKPTAGVAVVAPREKVVGLEFDDIGNRGEGRVLERPDDAILL